VECICELVGSEELGFVFARPFIFGFDVYNLIKHMV
jgi:hypothetical protein